MPDPIPDTIPDLTQTAALTPMSELRSPEAVVDDLTDTLLAIAAFGLHDSRRAELEQYARAALARYNQLAGVTTVAVVPVQRGAACGGARVAL